MYLVVSYWEPVPGREADFDRIGPQVGAVLRQQPGVMLVEVFKSGNKHVAVHGYQDEATYHAIVDNSSGAFVRAVTETRFEEVGRWLGSERGETLPIP
ncbi:MAG TPA: hypothetical protein VFA07_20260 [Chthonomonadaceae bacterium]|nr:hypothetical protein [Chthonomonadaceae bacterium]